MPRTHRFAVECLEQRTVLSGVTLITHGFGGSVDGWVTEMANAISAAADIDQPRYVVRVTDPGRDGGPLSVENVSASGPPLAGAGTDYLEAMILLDWSDVAGSFSFNPFFRSTVDVGAAVAEALMTPGFLSGLASPVVELPLHLIGHSRGGSLVGEIARNLGESGVWVDHVTTLDPHPVDGVRDPFGVDFGDAPMAAWENVVFWDNYWRTDGATSLDFTGESISGSFDLQLSESVLDNFTGYTNEHSDTHLWYHGTIDTNGRIDDGSASVSETAGWYDGPMGPRSQIGYFYSRLVGGLRPISGIAAALGGQGTRVAVANHSADIWPNLLALELLSPDVIVAGEPLELGFAWYDRDSAADLQFFLDVDRNPYNGAGQPIDEALGLAVTPSVPGTVEGVGISTDAVLPGRYYLAARIDDGPRSRMIYHQNAIELLTPRLNVTSFQPTASGFKAEFGAVFDTNALNLYDTPAAAMGPADVLLESTERGLIAGSLVVDPSGRAIQFVASGSPLLPGEYTATLRGAADGFIEPSGIVLDGDGDGFPGGDFRVTFLVAPPAENTVTIGTPDVVRGPGQVVNLPADSAAGIPLVLESAGGVRELSFEIHFDPRLIEISAANLGTDAPAGAAVSFAELEPGLVEVLFASPSELPAGTVVPLNLNASIPAGDAENLSGQIAVLELQSILALNGGAVALPVVENNALLVLHFFGDVSGNRRINAGDASQIARFAALLGTGFSGSLLVDPMLLGDVTGNARINAGDAAKVAQFAALLPVPEIPPIPAVASTAGRASGPANSAFLWQPVVDGRTQDFALDTIAERWSESRMRTVEYEAGRAAGEADGSLCAECPSPPVPLSDEFWAMLDPGA